MSPLPIVEKGLPPPLTQSAWLPEVVALSLEVLPLFRDEEGIAWLRPIHAKSLRLGTSPSRQPADGVMNALARYNITPIVVHSTSWRTEADRTLLSYVAVVPPFHPEAPGPLTLHRVGSAELARGSKTAAPRMIAVEQVIEHALRHLSWLIRDDSEIAAALEDWSAVLSDFLPEPFRAFQG